MTANGKRFGLWSVVLAALLALAGPVGCWPSASPSPGGQPPAEKQNDVFDKGAGRAPTPETLHALARLLASQGRDAESERVLADLVTRHPNFVPAYSDLAEVQVRHRRIDDAIQTLSAGLKVRPEDPVLLNNLGMCRFLKGEYPKALDCFTRAAGARPQDALYRANMAMILGLMGRDEEAAALYAQVLPEKDAGRNLAVLRDARGDRQETGKDKKETTRPGGNAEPSPAGP